MPHRKENGLPLPEQSVTVKSEACSNSRLYAIFGEAVTCKIGNATSEAILGTDREITVDVVVGLGTRLIPIIVTIARTTFEEAVRVTDAGAENNVAAQLMTDTKTTAPDQFR